MSKHITAWLTTLSSAFFFFVVFIQMNMFNALDTGVTASFHLTASQFGLLSACFFYANVFCLVPVGVIIDRVSTRRLLLTVMLGFTGLTLLLSLAQTYMQALLLRTLLGLVASFAWLSVLKIISRWFDPKRMAFVVGAVITFVTFGGVMAQTPLAWLADHHGWRFAVQCIAALSAILFLPMAVWVQDSPDHKVDHPPAATESLGLRHQLREAMTNAQNWIAGGYICLVNLPLFVYGAVWGSSYLHTIHQLSHIQASYVTSMIFLGMMIGSPFFGYGSDRSRQRLFPMRVVALGSLILGLVLLGVHHLPLPVLMLLFFAIGFIAGGQTIGYPYVIEHNRAAVAATANSLASMLIMLGSFIQPLYGYLLTFKSSSMDFATANLTLPIAYALALGLTYLMKETHCQHQDVDA